MDRGRHHSGPLHRGGRAGGTYGGRGGRGFGSRGFGGRGTFGGRGGGYGFGFGYSRGGDRGRGGFGSGFGSGSSSSFFEGRGGAGIERRATNVNVFFTGVPLNVDKSELRKHFERIGHVVDFRIFDPKPGIDYRHGLVEYMNEKTATDAISRLNGTVFGERAMRVEEVKQRGRDLRGGPGKRPREFSTAERPATGMNFPRGFVDPVLGRSDGAVLDVLRSLSTDDAYEAVEQLRVLALERRPDAVALLQENPALRSAVVMILQHAGRLPTAGSGGGGSALPAEAFQGNASSTTGGSSSGTGTGGGGGSTHGSQRTPAAGSAADGAAPAKRVATETADKTIASSATAAATAQPPAAAAEDQQDEVMEIVGAMSEEDVERVLMMTSEDLAQVSDEAQRRQLEILRDKLIEMSSGL